MFRLSSILGHKYSHKYDMAELLLMCYSVHEVVLIKAVAACPEYISAVPSKQFIFKKGTASLSGYYYITNTVT